MNVLLMIIGGLALLILLQVILYALIVWRFSDYANKVNDIFEQRTIQKEKERNSGK